MTRASSLVTNKSVLKASKRSNKTIKTIKLLCCLSISDALLWVGFPLKQVAKSQLCSLWGRCGLPQKVCADDACSLLPSPRSTLAKCTGISFRRWIWISYLRSLPFIRSSKWPLGWFMHYKLSQVSGWCLPIFFERVILLWIIVCRFWAHLSDSRSFDATAIWALLLLAY